MNVGLVKMWDNGKNEKRRKTFKTLTSLRRAGVEITATRFEIVIFDHRSRNIVKNENILKKVDKTLGGVKYFY